MITEQQVGIEKLSALYDRIYNIADRLFKKHNPCGISVRGTKIYCAHHNKPRSYNTNRLCCSGCGEYPENDVSHWSKTGCTTKCLACKLYFCGYIIRKNIRLANQLDRLYRFANKYSLPHSKYYLSKEKWLEQMQKKTHGIKRFSLTMEV